MGLKCFYFRHESNSDNIQGKCQMLIYIILKIFAWINFRAPATKLEKFVRVKINTNKVTDLNLFKKSLI